ncbi:MAG: hypothetical protein MUF53_06105 [Gemmatimonadaceae bacterium]|jgi:hypothetical protein|nr:hypothetical protein [Gemmatimonadaceae bacterium]
MPRISQAFVLALEPLLASARQLDANGRHAWLRELERESPLVAEAVRALLEGEAAASSPPAPRPSLIRGMWLSLREQVDVTLPASDTPVTPSPRPH